MVLRIGLTGGIGSGKSTVAALLAGLGATIVDTDAIARQIALPGGAAMGSIRESFGAEFIDAAGGLDRERMRALAFSDDTARRRLEAILHPLIGVETERLAAASSAPVIVFDVPLLVESGRWRARVHKVLVVDCAEATQIARVVARSGWAAEAVQAVIDRQASRARRRACADAVIFNEGLSPARLGDELRSLWHAWTKPATDRSPSA
ncbi:MAG: dephospho-CoA kinase [Burkholderiaceae bacterium]